MKPQTFVLSQWDRVSAMVAAGAGALLLLLGWFGVSKTSYPAEQIPYIASAGLGGLFLLGVAATLWISADLRDEWRKLDRIEAAILGQATTGGAVEAPVTTP
jgi:hypothetical protein